MFWKKKNTVEYDGLPVTLSRRSAYNYLTEEITKHFLAYKYDDEWRGLVGYEEFRKEIDTVEQKLNLILDHLNLEYVPETDKKEPAKLVEKKKFTISGMGVYITGNSGTGIDTDTMLTNKLNKKKRGRPKKK